MNKSLERHILISQYDTAMETRRWFKEIPYVRFKPNWEVKIIPPFSGASVRFLVREDDKEISIYLDCYNQLGHMTRPYWEMYPSNQNGGDPARFFLNETELLLKEIENTFLNFFNKEV